uniref:Superoxide dismutase [Cu-Zn] n=1 Tax=Globodera rostochiensis TaxID=31243 RepID=A0A914HZ97_GLORO
MVLKAPGHTAYWTFCPLDISPIGHFAHWTFRPLDISYPTHFDVPMGETRNVQWAKCPMGEMSNGRNVQWAKCPMGECPIDKMSNGRNAKCPMGEMSNGRNVQWAKCPMGEMSNGRMSNRQNVQWAKPPSVENDGRGYGPIGYGYGQIGHGHWRPPPHSGNCAKRVVQARVLMFKATNNTDSTPSQPIGVVDIFESAYGTTSLNGSINGLTPGDHGFHFHQFGDLSQACAGAGAHFNPHNKKHGAPDATERHVGDLGNLVANAHGVAVVNIRDHMVTLNNGVNSVVGRALVLHEKKDDLGLAANEESLKTGNSGKRVACGLVGIIKEL